MTDGTWRLCAVLFAVHLIYFAVEPTAVFAASAKEQYNKLDRDIRQHKKKLEQTRKIEASVVEDLRRAAEELREVDRRHRKQRANIRTIQEKIAAVQDQISRSTAALDVRREHLKRRLRAIQRANAQSDALLILLSTDDLGRSMRLMRYLRDISARDRELIAKYQEDLTNLHKEEEQLARLKGSLQGEEKKLARIEGELKEKQQRREELLGQVRKDKATYERLIESLKEDQKRLSRIVEEAERRERERRRSAGKPSSGKHEVYEDSAFTRKKGRLPWPVSGSVELKYGSQVDPIFNLPVFRSGITINAASGTSAKAIADGQVVYAETFKGYGQLVIVSHGGGYHTLYGNLSKIFSKNGAIIKENQAVGEVGESQATGNSGLYFEIRYKGKPLDPQQWLGRR
ncbi:MAG TPA: peptidoglycan DD-metalloendopeptidase family protein [Dissulfurispiraceae bacterium]|nr:peptidoglycan DD-metalloendopeptidase family protein [Dissulfurispiraceae bacterium]